MTDKLTCACGNAKSRKAKRCRPCGLKSRAETLRVRAAGRRHLPADFVSIAPGKTNEQIRLHYGCGFSTVVRWFKEAGIQPSPPTNTITKPRRPVPDGFALVARRLTMKELRERFGASEAIVKRWCTETGTEPRRAGYVRFAQVTPRPLIDHREQSRAGLAAQFLQRFGQVIRCDADGAINPKGTHWLRGGRFVLTDAEIMERATRNGWQPDAWREVIAA